MFRWILYCFFVYGRFIHRFFCTGHFFMYTYAVFALTEFRAIEGTILWFWWFKKKIDCNFCWCFWFVFASVKRFWNAFHHFLNTALSSKKFTTWVKILKGFGKEISYSCFLWYAWNSGVSKVLKHFPSLSSIWRECLMSQLYLYHLWRRATRIMIMRRAWQAQMRKLFQHAAQVQFCPLTLSRVDAPPIFNYGEW